MEPSANHAALSALVVEDETLLRMLVAETLREAGFDVHEAADGLAALAHLASNPETHFMISDIRMPRMNGYEAAERATKLYPHLRVLLMTGYSDEAIPKSLSERGIQILRKPFDIDGLPVLVNGLIKRDKSDFGS